MVIVIKNEHHLNSREVLLQLAQNMINIESGQHIYNKRGGRGSKKKFNEYTHNGVTFDIKPIAGKIIIFSHNKISIDSLIEIIDSLYNEHASKYININSTQHTAISVKKELKLKTNFGKNAYRGIFPYLGERDVQNKLKTSTKVFKWFVGHIDGKNNIHKSLFNLDKSNSVNYLSFSPSTIILDNINCTYVDNGFKSLNYLKEDQFKYYPRYVKKRVLDCNIYKLFYYWTNNKTPIDDYRVYSFIKWDSIKQHILNKKSHNLLNCTMCNHPLFDTCKVAIIDKNKYLVLHKLCKYDRSCIRFYYTECPQSLSSVLNFMDWDINSKHFIEGCSYGFFEYETTICVINPKRKKIFINTTSYSKYFAHDQVYLYEFC